MSCRWAPLCALLALSFTLSSTALAHPSAEDARARIGSMPGLLGDAPVEMTPDALRAVRDVRTAPGRLPHLQVAVSDGDPLPLPLDETRVFAELSGFIAQVDVVQTYRNPFDRPIEAIYTFPLPENSAVDDLTIRIADRVIRADIQKREDAKRTYVAAKRAGHTAALLEQERPNIFTQSVANIAPGEAIEVTIRYVQHLTYDAGTYEFVFPMVVGPRFMPGTPTGKSGSGWHPDTDEVPDASRISPPVIGAGMRTGHDIDVEVLLDPGFPLIDFDTPTHAVDAHTDDDGTMSVRLSEADRVPNRDFVLRYRVDGWTPQGRAIAAAGPEGEGGVVSLIVQPPRLDVDALVGAREVIFVVDISGSMRGVPLAQAKAAMRRALRRLGPDDTFNVYTFAGRTGQAFPSARPANETNLASALSFVEGARAGGGTHLANAVKAALSPEVADGRHRYVVFLTDGYVGNEAGILGGAEALVESQERAGRKARVFGMGIGSSVNRNLIEGLAKSGDGTAMYVTPKENPDRAIDRFYRSIDHPVLTDIRIDWGGLPVDHVEPSIVPDLLATRPLVVMAKYDAPAEGTVRVIGKLNGKDLTLPIEVSLPGHGDADRHQALPSLWARARVESLSRRLWRGHDSLAVEKITEIGLTYRLVTAYTSFVAVDRSRVVGDGDPDTVVQPVEAPAGVEMASAAPGARLGDIGIHRALRSTKLAGGPMRSLFGEEGEMSGKPNAAMAGSGDALIIGEGVGGMGLGTRGMGCGGCGVSDSIGGLGRGDTGGGRGYGRGAGAHGGKKRATPQVIPAKPVVLGSISKAMIQRVIRRHRNAVRYCYEKQLAKNPTLAGKLTLAFIIDAAGNVISATIADDSLPDPAVGLCVARSAKRWRFPNPKGGGQVVVKYPFSFKPE